MSDLEAQLRAGEASDGYHTHNELYEYRMLYNAALFNTWHEYQHCADSYGAWPDFPEVCKSRHHSDGELCFGSLDWFVVVAQLPTGQISNHYKIEHWNLFKIPAVSRAPEWDGHTPEQAAQRLREFLKDI